MRILVAEDNPKMATLIREGVSQLGYAVDVVGRGRDAESEAFAQPYDAILLDLMLPDMDGVEVCRNLRRKGVSTPILVLTALSGLQDKVAALDAGADDYVTKPFEFDELLARLRALLRRGRPHEGTVLRVEDLELDLARHVVLRAGIKIRLSNREFALLEFFARNPNRVLGRAQIADHVWGMDFSGESNIIEVYVGMLRRKLDNGFDRRLIHTIVGRGYFFGARLHD